MPPQPFHGQNIDGQARINYPTPNRADEELVSILAKNVDDYVSVLVGTPPPENANPSMMLCQQIPIDWNHVQRTYAKDRTLQAGYNANVTFDEDSATHPTFIRDYIVRRSLTPPATASSTRATALAGIVASKVTAGGSGYTQSTVSATLSTGTGTVTPIVSNGAVVHLAITGEGTYTTAPTVTISDTGGGTGATATVHVQGATAYLVKEEDLRMQDSPLDGLWILVRRTYMTLPGPALTDTFTNGEYPGATLTRTRQKDLVSALTPSSAGTTLSSEVKALTSVVGEITTEGFSGGVLPADVTYAYWDYVPLPLLLFGITNDIYCNDSSLFKVITNPSLDYGSSQFRKHRRTISYSSTPPNLTPNLSGSAYAARMIEHRGYLIQFSYNNALTDTISYDEDFYNATDDYTCVFTEQYSFPATGVSATDFITGLWLTKQLEVRPIGPSCYQLVKDEFYSIPGNPTIVIPP